MSDFLYRLSRLLTESANREEGQTLVEYAFLVAFIALVVLVAVQLLGTNITALFNSVATAI
jgi:pilus assembly protein Flp/PilA